MKRLLSSLTFALLLGAVLIITPTGMTQDGSDATTSEPVKFGMGPGSIAVTTEAGAKIDYETFWVGPWTLKHGWGGPDSQMTNLRSQGVTPAIHYYYWGDDISPSCVEDGCWSDLHGAWKDQAGWQQLASELVEHLDAKMQGDEVIIFLETEFNKGGIAGYEPFDGYLAEKAAFIKKEYPNAQVVLPFGNWNQAAWSNFDRAAEASDLVGIQGMRGSTRDSYAHYRDLYESTLSGAQHIKGLFDKPVLVHDLALSTYPEPEYLEYQRAELKEFFDGMPDLKAAGVEAIIYRSWYDSKMDLANYYGEAERHWGFSNRDTHEWKPAAHVWIDGIKAERANSASPADPDEPSTLTASFRLGSVNEWWVETYVTASNPIASVAAQVDGGHWTDLPKKSWGSHAKSFYVPTGSDVVFRVTDTYGQTVQSGTYDWLVSDTPTGPATDPATDPAYEATFRLSPNVNEWWVEVYVDATTAPASVDVQLNGGSWSKLSKSSWGAYTKSTYVPKGSEVAFRATDANGQAALSETYTWLTSEETNTPPKAAFTATATDLSVALDASASSDDDGDSLAYTWTLGDGASATGQTVDHTYADGGTYEVTLTVDDGEATTTATETLQVTRPNRAPVADFTATMSELSGSFDASASSDPDGDALRYTWSFGDGGTGTGTETEHTYAEAGDYTVTVHVEDTSGASTTTSKSVTATQPNRAPLAGFTATMSDLTGSFDASASSDPDGDALRYTWSFGDGGTGTGTKTEHTYAEAGDYTVTLHVEDTSGASTTTSKSVTAIQPNRAPVADFTATMSELTGSFDARGSSDPDGDALGYTWDLGDGTLASGATVEHEYAEPGTYTVRLWVDDGELIDEQSREVSVDATPFTVTFHPSPNMNEWWVETYVTASSTPVLVEARTNEGQWHTLSATSWGSYAKSFRVPPGAAVTFRATDAYGQSVVSEPWTSEPPKPAFDATFTPRTQSNGWWVEVAVEANQPIANVEVQKNGGPWKALPETSWDTYATKMRAPSGTSIVFRATDVNGQTDLSDTYRWG